MCDIPVGTGKMTDILLKFNLKVTSGDISEEMMQFIDLEFREHPNYMEEKVIDASSLPYPDNSFDLLVNIRLIHKVDPSTRIKILEEAHRVAKSYYIVSFGVDSLWQKIRMKLKSRDPSPGREKKKQIKKEIESVGFEIIKERSVLPIFSNEVIFLLKKNY